MITKTRYINTCLKQNWYTVYDPNKLYFISSIKTDCIKIYKKINKNKQKVIKNIIKICNQIEGNSIWFLKL